MRRSSKSFSSPRSRRHQFAEHQDDQCFDAARITFIALISLYKSVPNNYLEHCHRIAIE